MLRYQRVLVFFHGCQEKNTSAFELSPAGEVPAAPIIVTIMVFQGDPQEERTGIISRTPVPSKLAFLIVDAQ